MRRRIDRKRSTRLRIENDKDNNNDDDDDDDDDVDVDFKKILFLQIPYIQTILATELTHSSRTYKHFFFRIFDVLYICRYVFWFNFPATYFLYRHMISYTFYT